MRLFAFYLFDPIGICADDLSQSRSDARGMTDASSVHR